MKTNIIFLITVFFLSVTTLNANSYKVIPEPYSLKQHDGNFIVSNKTKINISKLEKEIQRIANYLSERLNSSVGITLKTNTASFKKKHNISFINDKNLKAEAYRLEILPDQVKISYVTPAGAFYAVQTLLQLFPVDVYANTLKKQESVLLPCVSIYDFPRFSYRGMMLDVCRHFMPVEFIKQYIDMMAMCKINRFHWHLTEDQGWRIEIKKYPLLTQVGSRRNQTVVGNWKSGIYDGKPSGGYYTQEEAKEIVRYAAERFITVIPEIELPGHSLAALASYPNLSCFPEKKYNVGETWGVFTEVYCPKEETFTFLQDVFSELFAIFPSAYYHIGGDECPKESWKACSNCQELIRKEGLKDEHELQSYFIGRIEKFLNAHGKNIIGWDEILEGGLAPNATVMSWRGESGGIAAAQQKHKVIMTPNTYCYFDYTQVGAESDSFDMGRNKFLPLETVYNYEPYSSKLTKEEQTFILGVQANVWTEFTKTPERIMEQTFPRAFALAEVAWSPANKKDYNSFKNRLLTMFRRMDAAGITYSNSFYSPIFYFDRRSKIYPKEVEIKIDYPFAEIYYTTDGSEPAINSEKYIASFSMNQGEVVKAVAFENNKQIGVVRTLEFSK